MSVSIFNLFVDSLPKFTERAVESQSQTEDVMSRAERYVLGNIDN